MPVGGFFAGHPPMNNTHHPLGWIDEQLGILQQRGLLRRLSTRTGAQSAMIVIEGKEGRSFRLERLS